MAVRWSCAIHVLVVLLLGCHVHRPLAPAVAPDAEMAEAKQFAQAVAEKMPAWDADTIACYEAVEIAAVKADVMATLEEDDRYLLLEDAARLHDDWDTLLALDAMLKQYSLI